MSERELHYDIDKLDIEDLMKQVKELAQQEQKSEATMDDIAPRVEQTVQRREEAAQTELPSTDEDPLWELHRSLRKTFSMGLEAEAKDPFFKHVYLMNRGYVTYDGEEPSDQIEYSFEPSSRPWIGGIIDRIRAWIFRLLGDYFVDREREFRAALSKQVQFNSEIVRLANDLKLKIETQRRFNETTTSFLQDVIYRLHDHACKLIEQAEEIEDVRSQMDTLHVLGNLAQISEERLEEVKKELEAIKRKLNEAAPERNDN